MLDRSDSLRNSAEGGCVKFKNLNTLIQPRVCSILSCNCYKPSIIEIQFLAAMTMAFKFGTKHRVTIARCQPYQLQVWKSSARQIPMSLQLQLRLTNLLTIKLSTLSNSSMYIKHRIQQQHITFSIRKLINTRSPRSRRSHVQSQPRTQTQM